MYSFASSFSQTTAVFLCLCKAIRQFQEAVSLVRTRPNELDGSTWHSRDTPARQTKKTRSIRSSKLLITALSLSSINFSSPFLPISSLSSSHSFTLLLFLCPFSDWQRSRELCFPLPLLFPRCLCTRFGSRKTISFLIAKVSWFYIFAGSFSRSSKSQKSFLPVDAEESSAQIEQRPHICPTK